MLTPESIPNRFNVGVMSVMYIDSGLYGNDAGPIWNAIWDQRWPTLKQRIANVGHDGQCQNLSSN